MPPRAPAAPARPLRIDFDRIKYGRELLIDAACIQHMPRFIVDGTPHALTFYDLLLVTHGRGAIWLDGEQHLIAPGDVLFCLPGQVRQWRMSTPLDGACLFFTREFMDDTFRDSRFLDHFAFFHLPRPAATLRLKRGERRQFQSRFATMQRELRLLQPDSAHPLRAALYGILVQLNRWYIAAHGTGPTVVPEDFVERFRQLLDVHFSQHHRLSYYAEKLGLTAGHLNALCRRQTGLTAGALIRSRIALEARRLLLYGDLTAAQICERLGFRDPAYFGRFFRREVGASPQRFRQRRDGRD